MQAPENGKYSITLLTFTFFEANACRDKIKYEMCTAMKLHNISVPHETWLVSSSKPRTSLSERFYQFSFAYFYIGYSSYFVHHGWKGRYSCACCCGDDT